MAERERQVRAIEKTGVLDWLQGWYDEQCNGIWEHERGIRVDTLDNPGWRVEVDLVGTRYEGLHLTTYAKNEGDANWVVCSIVKGKFIGSGGPSKLTTIVEYFRSVVVSSDSHDDSASA